MRYIFLPMIFWLSGIPLISGCQSIGTNEEVGTPQSAPVATHAAHPILNIDKAQKAEGTSSGASEHIADARLVHYQHVSKALLAKNDEALHHLLSDARTLEQGGGGDKFKLTIDSIPVFVKVISLTKTELDHLRSTQNFFNLPLAYQYGVGSRGFGAWRELAAHLETTQWVLSGENQHFPLLYHWRVISHPPKTHSDFTDEDLDYYVHFWGDSKAVRERELALRTTSADLVLFLEYIPNVMAKLLKDVWRDENMLQQIEEQIESTVAFMSSKGMYHFDTHFDNMLTDGSSLYFTDFGLSNSLDFDLSPEERSFLAQHENYDLALSMENFCTSVLRRAVGTYDIKIDETFIRDVMSGKRHIQLSDTAAAIVRRWGPTAIVMQKFFAAIRQDNSKTVPFPERELREAISAAKHTP